MYYAFEHSGSNWNLKVLVFGERGKPLGAEKEPTTNLAHIWSMLRIEPYPYLWEASALTTAPALLPIDCSQFVPDFGLEKYVLQF